MAVVVRVGMWGVVMVVRVRVRDHRRKRWSLVFCLAAHDRLQAGRQAGSTLHQNRLELVNRCQIQALTGGEPDTRGDQGL